MAVAPLTPELLRAIERTKAEYFAKRAQALIDVGREIKVGRFGHATALLWPDYNRVYGFGAEDLPRLDDLLAWYAEEEESPVFEILPFRDNDAVLRELAARGFSQTSSQSVLAGAPHPDLPQPVSIRWIGLDEIESWAEIYIRAYDWKLTDEEHVKELVAQYTSPQWRLCLGEMDGETAAMGALFLGKEAAYLANAATLPDYRGRGGQLSMIAARSALAAQEGYEILGSDCPPYGSSQRNLERAGLRIACHKTRWSKGS